MGAPSTPSNIPGPTPRVLSSHAPHQSPHSTAEQWGWWSHRPGSVPLDPALSLTATQGRPLFPALPAATLSRVPRARTWVAKATGHSLQTSLGSQHFPATKCNKGGTPLPSPAHTHPATLPLGIPDTANTGQGGLSTVRYLAPPTFTLTWSLAPQGLPWRRSLVARVARGLV